MRTLTVGLIAPPWVAVPPSEYGGTESVIDQLARGLSDAGCDVRLFASGDSTCPVARSWLYPTALGTTADEKLEQAHIERAYAELTDVDVIHDHTLYGIVRPDLHSPGIPVITTVHGPFTPELADLYRLAAAAGVGVVAISQAQRASATDIPVLDVIHHGVDFSQFPMGSGGGGYVLFLGRMSAEKGAHRAITIARAAGRRIVVAAKMWEREEHRYFADQVAPLLGDDAVYIGEVGGVRKLRLLAGAEALLNPIRWPEPFGLVMVEAMACGTPVLAFAEGAAPEIVAHGTTGFLSADEQEMSSHLELVPTIDRQRCRDRVETLFSARRMVQSYVRQYEQMIERFADPPEGIRSGESQR
jgi:glycosyltransferase involved in cell wall biosynthesis